ncbi:MAG: hypothetical protein QM783_20560 [Phycisphaerales bacterium]
MAAPSSEAPTFRLFTFGNLGMVLLTIGLFLVPLRFATHATHSPLLTTLTSGAVIGGCFALGVLLVAVMFWNGRLNTAERSAIEQVARLSIDDARAAALAAIEGTVHFTSQPARSPTDPTLPPTLRDLFDRFERVEYRTLAGSSMAVFDRGYAVPLNFCSNAVGAGRFSSLLEIAVDVPTGRAFMTSRNSSVKQSDKSITDPRLSHPSIWHLIAYFAARSSLADLRRQGQRLGA